MFQSENEVLAEMLDYHRSFTLRALADLTGDEFYQTFSANGKTLNSALWIAGHLATTENYLVLRSTGAEIVRFSWAKQFGMGAPIPAKEEYPPIEEILQTLHTVHQACLERIRNLRPEEMDLPTTTGFQINGQGTFRGVIRHAVFHEGTHAGHLTWIQKMLGKKTI